MVDFLLIILIIVAVIWGTKNKSHKLAPYVASLVLGILLAFGLHNLVAKYINTTTRVDYTFSSVVAFVGLVTVGATIFYGCLLFYYHLDNERAEKLYSNFSKANFIAIPILVVAVFCMLAVIFAEFPTRTQRLLDIQTTVSRAISVKTFKSLIQKAGVNPSLVQELKETPLSPGEESEQVIPLSFKSVEIKYDQQLELDMTKLINEERSKNGKEPLKYESNLADVARNHSIDMLQRRYFAHINLDGETPFDRLQAAKISYKLAGENLAVSGNLEAAVKALMESPKHKENILNGDFHKTGIGIATNQDGIMVITQEFTN